jgi:hypothetical protein
MPVFGHDSASVKSTYVFTFLISVLVLWSHIIFALSEWLFSKMFSSQWNISYILCHSDPAYAQPIVSSQWPVHPSRVFRRVTSCISHPRWSSGYRACHWTQGSLVQTWPWTMELRCTTSFGKEVKPSVPCRKMLQRVKYSYSMKEIIRRQNSRTFLAKIFLLRY